MVLKLGVPCTVTYRARGGESIHTETGEFGGIILHPDGQARFRIEWEMDDGTSQDIALDRVLNVRLATEGEYHELRPGWTDP
jgi:hypothetical protein